MADESPEIMFLYWGRRGAMTRFGLELYRAALARQDARREPCQRVTVTMSISTSNELFDDYAALGGRLFPVDTFERNRGAVTAAWRVPMLRAALGRRLRSDGTAWVVNLMPHVWSPLVGGAIRRTGCRTATVIHDATPHPGDRSGLVLDWCNSVAHRSDRVVTLSEAVRRTLIGRGRVPEARILPLFHPDLPLGRPARPAARAEGAPFRLLFLGRILPYKGLPLLVEALEILRARGVEFTFGLFGEGDIGALAERLERLNAVVVNRWQSDAELADLLDAWDAVALSHVEASQSGIAAVAAAAGLPVVATPVGALREQVRDGLDGVLARAATPSDFADALERLISDPALQAAIRRALTETAPARTMDRFLDALLAGLRAAER